MKWVDFDQAKKDGTYLTYITENNSMGILVKIDDKWNAKMKEQLVPIHSDMVKAGINKFMRIVPPK